MAKADKSSRTVFTCQNCGRESLKWLGRCPDCQEWNTFVETRVTATVTTVRSPITLTPPQELAQVTEEAAARYPVPLAEFNRVLGGGLVAGSLVLVGGEPGIGKSTLLLQVAAAIASPQRRIAYVS
ncbi:MAG: AAA family ATPase, partial [Chloroflexota bacterium]